MATAIQPRPTRSIGSVPPLKTLLCSLSVDQREAVFCSKFYHQPVALFPLVGRILAKHALSLSLLGDPYGHGKVFVDCYQEAYTVIYMLI